MLTRSELGGSLGREFRRLHFCGLHWGRSHDCHGMLVVSVKPQAPNHRLNIWVWPEKQRTPKWIRMVHSKGTIIEYHWIMYHISGNTKSTSPGYDHRWWLVINYYKRPQNISQKHILYLTIQRETPARWIIIEWPIFFALHLPFLGVYRIPKA